MSEITVTVSGADFLEAWAAVGVGRWRQSTFDTVAVLCVDGTVSLRTYNFTVWADVVLGPGVGDGQWAVPFADVDALVSALKPGRKDVVTFGVGAEGTVFLTAGGRSASRVVTLTERAFDFPEPDVHTFTIDRDVFLAAVSTAAVSRQRNSDSILQLTGVHVVASNGQVRVECTDRFRAGQATLAADVSADCDVVVSSEVVGAVKRLPAGPVRVCVKADDSQAPLVMFASGNTRMAVSEVSGQYPNLDRALASGFAGSTTVNLPAKTLVDAASKAGRMAAAVDEKLPVVWVKAEADGVRFVPGCNSGKAPLLPAAVSGPGVDVPLNASYLLDAAAACTGDVELTVGSSVLGLRDSRSRQVVMAVRVVGAK